MVTHDGAEFLGGERGVCDVISRFASAHAVDLAGGFDDDEPGEARPFGTLLQPANIVHEQTVLLGVLDQLRATMPFPLLGFDVDNDSVFMNESVRDYCLDAGIVFTRCRPYRKNDKAHIEQKNGSVVRRIVGYRRLEGMEAARELTRLYATTRLFVNAFQPSFKLMEKDRDGARVRKRYHTPMTPCDRLHRGPRIGEETRRQVEMLRADLDPVRLLADMRERQSLLMAIADGAAVGGMETAPVPIDTFLGGTARGLASR